MGLFHPSCHKQGRKPLSCRSLDPCDLLTFSGWGRNCTKDALRRGHRRAKSTIILISWTPEILPPPHLSPHVSGSVGAYMRWGCRHPSCGGSAGYGKEEKKRKRKICCRGNRAFRVCWVYWPGGCGGPAREPRGGIELVEFA